MRRAPAPGVACLRPDQPTRRHAARALLFIAGLATVLVPLGFGAALVGTLLVVHRSASILVIGGLLIALGVLQARGGLRLVPTGLLERRLTAFHLGLVYAVGGFCSGPLLGGVLTLAVGAAQPLVGAALLLVFAVGMALPLFALAAIWQRVGRSVGRDRADLRWLRQHADALGGALLIALGVGFIVFQGGSGLSGVYADLGLTARGAVLEAWLAEQLDHLRGS
jgi:cytochrome c biogenesis protein CcdA